MKLPKGVRLDDTGLVITGPVSYRDWAALGPAISSARRVMTWALGDWMLYGESAWGEKYTQALDQTGYSMGALVTIASVCSRIPPAQRKAALSFEHHRTVAYLPVDERPKWLAKAEDSGWTREELRERIMQARGEEREPRTVVCPNCHHSFVLTKAGAVAFPAPASRETDSTCRGLPRPRAPSRAALPKPS